MAAERAAGTSQYGFKQLFNLFARALFDFSSMPLHLGLILGGGAIALSTLYFVFILGWLLFGKECRVCGFVTFNDFSPSELSELPKSRNGIKALPLKIIEPILNQTYSPSISIIAAKLSPLRGVR